MEEPVSVNQQAPAPKGRRVFAALVDLVFIPTFLGLPVGLILTLLAVQDPLLSILLAAINIGWLVFRDHVFSPGRDHAKRRVLSIVYLFICGAGLIFGASGAQPGLAAISVLAAIMPTCILLFDKPGPDANLKLISLTSGKVSLSQAFIRNVLIGLPFVLLVGYPVELLFLLLKGERLTDSWAKTRVVTVAA